MIYSLVLHILACTDDVADSYCMHILARNAKILHRVLLLPPQKLINTFAIIIDSEEQACSRPCSQHQRKWLSFFSLMRKGNYLKSMSEKRVENFQ